MKVHHHAVSEEVVNPPPESDRIYVLLSVDLHAPRLPRHLLDGVDDPPPPGGPQRMSSDVREDLGGSLFGETEDTTRPRTRLAVERSVVPESPVIPSVSVCVPGLGFGLVLDHDLYLHRAGHLLQWYDLPTMFSLEFCLGFLVLLDILGYIFCLKSGRAPKCTCS
ncbi:hypothetical protein JZ751_025781, partial [Albula glossodonta]